MDEKMMDMESIELPLISVIIPVYKVEDYLADCVESVINQTYIRLEIILVDDGSPDNCPQMCEVFAQMDNRIKVYHKKNGGLSDARNYGIKVAQGEYLAFVDSDDYIMEQTIERLYNGILKHEADIEACKIYSLENGQLREYDRNGNNIKDSTPYISGMQYLQLYIGGEIENATWNKLYKRECFRDVRFRKGRNNEDFLMFYELCPKINKIGFVNYFGYVYRQREGSIVHNPNKFLYFDIIKNIEEIKKDIHTYHPSLVESIDKKEIEERIIFMKSVLTRKKFILLRREFSKNYKILWSKSWSYVKQLPINFHKPFYILRLFPFLYTLKSCLKKDTL